MRTKRQNSDGCGKRMTHNTPKEKNRKRKKIILEGEGKREKEITPKSEHARSKRADNG